MKQSSGSRVGSNLKTEGAETVSIDMIDVGTSHAAVEFSYSQNPDQDKRTARVHWGHDGSIRSTNDVEALLERSVPFTGQQVLKDIVEQNRSTLKFVRLEHFSLLAPVRRSLWRCEMSFLGDERQNGCHAVFNAAQRGEDSNFLILSENQDGQWHKKPFLFSTLNESTPLTADEKKVADEMKEAVLGQRSNLPLLESLRNYTFS